MSDCGYGFVSNYIHGQTYGRAYTQTHGLCSLWVNLDNLEDIWVSVSNSVSVIPVTQIYSKIIQIYSQTT